MAVESSEGNTLESCRCTTGGLSGAQWCESVAEERAGPRTQAAVALSMGSHCHYTGVGVAVEPSDEAQARGTQVHAEGRSCR